MPLSTQFQSTVQLTGEIRAIINVLGAAIVFLSERDAELAQRLTHLLDGLDANVAKLRSEHEVDKDNELNQVSIVFLDSYSKQLRALRNLLIGERRPGATETMQSNTPEA